MHINRIVLIRVKRTSLNKINSTLSFLEKFDFINKRELQTFSQFIIELKLGTARAGLIRFEHAYSLQKQYGGLKIIPVALDKKSFVQDEKIGILKENKQLIQDISFAVDKLKKNKTISKIHKKWFDRA